MEKVTRNVAEIEAADRRALERVIGERLTEHQQVIISVVNLDAASPEKSAASSAEGVPAWWNIYEGLSDEEVDRLDQAIRQRANLSSTPISSLATGGR